MRVLYYNIPYQKIHEAGNKELEPIFSTKWCLDVILNLLKVKKKLLHLSIFTNSGDTLTPLIKLEFPSIWRVFYLRNLFLHWRQLLFFWHRGQIRCFLPTSCNREATHVKSFLIPWEGVQRRGQLAQGTVRVSHRQDSPSRRAKYWLQGSDCALESAVMIKSYDCHFIRWLVLVFPILLATQTAAETHRSQAT